MALPSVAALKCPYLAKLTLQQVRASAPNILSAGAESCPIFSQFVRKMTTTSTFSNETPMKGTSLSMDEIRALHYKHLHDQLGVNKQQREREHSKSAHTKMRQHHPTTKSSLKQQQQHHQEIYPSPYGEIIISTECQDLLCPFLKSTPITLRRVAMNQDTIEINRKLGTDMSVRPSTTLTPITIAKANTKAQFEYDAFFAEKIEAKKKDNSYRVFKRVQRKSGLFPQAEERASFNDDADGRLITVWCSNDYLGLGQHPKLKKAVIDAVNAHGSGSGGTRNISGTSPLHERLEHLLAKLHQKESALIFTSCYVANDTTLYTLAKSMPKCEILSDSGNHASMIQGIRNSQMPKHIFRHNDMEHLESLLKKIPKETPKIVAFETVHSMDGSICDLEAMIDISHEYGALTFIDEVHAVGLYGHNGAGIGERDHVLHKMDIISGTLGKAFGSIGGYIVGSAAMTDFIRSYGSGFIFTTSLPPTVAASATAAIQISMSDEGRQLRQRQQENVRELRSKLIDAGLPVMIAPSHIIPIHVGDAALATLLCNHLLDQHSIYVQSINYPTVERGTERLRIAPTPYHTSKMIDSLVESLTQVWQDVGLPLRGSDDENVGIQRRVAMRQ